MWPFSSKPDVETRADSSYTDALVAAITANASGKNTAFPTATASLEACAGIVGRAFAAAQINGADIRPDTMALIGRSLIRRGEILFRISVGARGIQLHPAASHDIDGSYDQDTWMYRLNLAGPSEQWTVERVPFAGVIHIKYACDPETSWRGYGPLQVAMLAGRLSAETVSALADEASGPRGAFLPLPIDGADPTIEKLKQDVRTLKGQIAFVESTADSWQSGGASPKKDWSTERIGANPPQSMVMLAQHSSMEVMNACGINPALFSAGDGTASREAYRQLLFSVLLPLGKLVSSELSLKLETDVTIEWGEIRAADITGRARAFQSMVGAGMDVSKAMGLSGLMAEE